MKSNRIHISDFQIDASNFPQITFNVSCSKGTYIRSIASDFGKKLHSGGTLIELRRIRSGEYRIEDAKQVDEWLEFIEKAEL